MNVYHQFYNEFKDDLNTKVVRDDEMKNMILEFLEEDFMFISN